jgi:hypothetical protein
MGTAIKINRNKSSAKFKPGNNTFKVPMSLRGNNDLLLSDGLNYFNLK